MNTLMLTYNLLFTLVWGGLAVMAPSSGIALWLTICAAIHFAAAGYGYARAAHTRKELP